MKISKFYPFGILALGLSFTACESDSDTMDDRSNKLEVDLQGLEDLGPDYRYENWIIVNGSPVSAGLFDVDANGQLSETSFSVDADDLANASTYVLTIEPSPDPDPAPSDVHILAGDFSAKSAKVGVGHAAALATDFSSANGSYILATPTDGGSMTDENSGVWFLDPSGPSASLNLGQLPAGWIYEGWVVINGQALSTGTFSDPAAADNMAPYSGMNPGPPYPGEDFLINAPSGLSFPTDLSEGTIVISVEPVPDNSPAPFLLKPLVGQVPANALDHNPYNLGNNASQSNPSGTVKR